MVKTLAEVAPDSWAFVDPVGANCIPQDILAGIAEFQWKSEQADILIVEIMLEASGQTSAPYVAAIYKAVTSGGSQKKIQDETFAYHLTLEQADVLGAIIDVVHDAQQPRNSFAHHMYCHSPALPRAVLLLDPKVWLAYAASNFASYEAVPGGPFRAMHRSETGLPRPLNEHLAVWDYWDIFNALGDLAQKSRLLADFRYALTPTGIGPVELRGLESEPLLQARLRSRRNQRKPKPPKTPRAPEPPAE